MCACVVCSHSGDFDGPKHLLLAGLSPVALALLFTHLHLTTRHNNHLSESEQDQMCLAESEGGYPGTGRHTIDAGVRVRVTGTVQSL